MGLSILVCKISLEVIARHLPHSRIEEKLISMDSLDAKCFMNNVESGVMEEEHYGNVRNNVESGVT